MSFIARVWVWTTDADAFPWLQPKSVSGRGFMISPLVKQELETGSTRGVATPFGKDDVKLI